MFSLARSEVMAARPEGDVNGVEFFMGVDVKSRRRDFAPEEL